MRGICQAGDSIAVQQHAFQRFVMYGICEIGECRLDSSAATYDPRFLDLNKFP